MLTTPVERERTRRVVAKVDATFHCNTPDPDSTVRYLTAAGFQAIFVEPPRFLIDNRVWETFDDAYGFDLFEAGESFQWSDWLELRFQKPPE